MNKTTAWLPTTTKITMPMSAASPRRTYLPASGDCGLSSVDELYKITLPSFVSN